MDKGSDEFAEHRQRGKRIPRHTDNRFFINPPDNRRFTGFYRNPVDQHLAESCDDIGSEVFGSCR